MISATRMSVTARAATLRSQVPTLKTAAVSQRSLIQSCSYATSRNTLLNSQHADRPVSQLVSPYAALPLTRSFHVVAPRLQQQQQKDKQEQQEKQEKQSEESNQEKSEEEPKKEGKKDAPPPPPHGDKTPWQVFRETLQTEFKASKEWNESTKALASSAHQFTENENIKKARAAYEAASGAATSKTATAIKTTGKAIGTSAAWTWNTPVVKGIRKGVNVTGSGIEKVTRPVRETEAYKSAVGGVKNAIDDGSSSRYGGYIEKEERRKQRKLREEAELKAGRRVEPMVEDPK